jgi:hypothetical protein
MSTTKIVNMFSSEQIAKIVWKWSVNHENRTGGSPGAADLPAFERGADVAAL